MMPLARIPHGITMLYILAVANMMTLFHMTVTDATVIVKNVPNATIREIDDLPASFGPPLSSEGLEGFLMYVNPTDACEKVNKCPPPVTGRKWIALIKRGPGIKGECHFDQKVLNAQRAGYIGAIIHNVGSDVLISMSGSSGGIEIPSVFIGMTGGKYLAGRNASKSVWIILNSNSSFDVDSALKYMIPFVVVVGISFLVTVAVAIGKWVRDYRRKRRSRLSKENLKKLPVKKFKKGDPYDVCAICLDEYEEGHKLRILPCSHAYHMKCVDPWLLNNKRVCPVCKRKVIPGDESSESESDYDEDNANEATPLLHPGESSINGNSAHNNFDSSGLPCSVRTEVSIPDSDSDGSVEPFPQSLASLAEVHTPVLSQPALHRNPTRTYGSLTSDQIVRHNSTRGIPGEPQPRQDVENFDETGAVEGIVNPGLDLVEEYYADTVDEAHDGNNEACELPSMLDNLQSSGSNVMVVDNKDKTGIQSHDDSNTGPI